MQLKPLFYILIVLLVFSCTPEKSEKPEVKQVEETKPKTRYTFSQYETVDFSMSSGSYQVLYDYSTPIDTIFTYSGAYKYGEDSIIYMRIKKDTFSEEITNPEDKTFYGSTTDLIMYNGTSFHKIVPPMFESHFSSFLVQDSYLFYWGFENFEYVYACRYNLKTKEFQKIKLSETVGTDFYAAYIPPHLTDNGQIRFEIDTDQYWILDFQFREIIKMVNEPVVL